MDENEAFTLALETALTAAVHWGRVDLRDETAEFSNWRFSRNGVAGEPGRVRLWSGGGPGFRFANCTIKGNDDPLALADVIVDLTNKALAASRARGQGEP